MTALDLEEIQPGISIADLERRWGISRNALKARAKALGVVLERKGPTLTVWPGNQVADGDRMDAHCKANGSLASFPGAVAVTPHDGSALAVTSHDGSGLAVTPQGVTDGNQLALLAAAVAAAMPQQRIDPMHRARALAEAADNALVLTAADLAALLGQGLSRWENGHLAYGYRFAKHRQGKQVLWCVSRAVLAAPNNLQATTPRSVGFLTAPPVSAAFQTINVQCVSLPLLSR